MIPLDFRQVRTSSGIGKNDLAVAQARNAWRTRWNSSVAPV
jgi:hypothetical protein